MELLRALSTGSVDELIGTAESDWLEFKSACYQLDKPKEKWELAKDVAAFANRQGGFIVIGVRTERHQHEVVDAVVSHSRVPKRLVDADAYRKIIGSWIYPRVRDVGFQWFPPEITEETGLLAINVRAQSEDDKPFVVRKMLNEEEKETGALGVPFREGAETDWMSAERAHHLMKSAIPPVPTGPTPPPTETREALTSRADERIADVEQLQGWEETPVYLLQALPPASGGMIEGFFDEGGPAAALGDPPSVRSTGFNLRMGGEREVVEGGVVYRRRSRLVWLDPDGLFTVAGEGTREFLGWAINDRRSEDILRVNSIGLVEFTFEFFRFVHQQLAPRASGTWNYRVICRGFQQGRLALAAGTPASLGIWFDAPVASSDDWVQPVEASGDPGRDALRALTQVYALFGLGSEVIPFSEQGAISEQAILDIR